MTDIVKHQVAAHRNRRAPTFDDDFGHSLRPPAEHAAWDRILGLVLPGGGALDALDAGCGTGGRSREQIATLLEKHGLVDVGSDPLLDLVDAQAQRLVDEGRERRTHRRYAVRGDVARPPR